MTGLPENLHERDIVETLLREWGLRAKSITYARVGFGSYHWTATLDDGRRVFLTADDLDAVHHGGRDAFQRITQAFDTARALVDAAHLQFVAAPVPTRAGLSAARATARYSLALFPYLEGRAGSFGTPFVGADRERLLESLAELHLTTGVAKDVAPRFDLGISNRHDLESALDALSEGWTSGPFAEPLRKALTAHAADLRHELREHDRMGGELLGPGAHMVVTHGEPHGGNVLQSPERLWLIDWDTVALAPPERDLWMLADESGPPDKGFDAYTQITGRAVDPGALEWFRLRWRLVDIAAFVAEFRRPHGRTSDTELGWTLLDRYLPVP